MKVKAFSTIAHYLKIWVTVVKVSTSRIFAYRTETFFRFFRGIFLLVVQVVFANAVIGKSSNYVGYTADQVYLFLGIFNTVGYISWAFFSINLARLEEKIQKGEFDFILYKPISSIFGASFMEFFIDELFTIISGALLIGYYIVKNFAVIPFQNYIYLAIAIALGVMIWFALDLIVASFDFLVLKSGFRSIRERVNSVARFPLNVWDPSVQMIFYTVVPIAFLSYVPTNLFIGNISPIYLLYAFVAVCVFLVIARSVWHACLKRYSSVN